MGVIKPWDDKWNVIEERFDEMDTWTTAPSSTLGRNQIIGDRRLLRPSPPPQPRPFKQKLRNRVLINEIKKPKKQSVRRRIRKMASKSGFSIPIIPLLFMAWAFGLFDSKDEKKNVNIETTNKKVESVVTQVKKTANDTVEKVRKQFIRDTEKKEEPKKEEPKKEEPKSTDQFRRDENMFKQKDLFK